MSIVTWERSQSNADQLRRHRQRLGSVLDRHVGALEQRLRSTDRGTEVQVIRFRDPDGYRDFMDDPERLARRLEFGDAVPVTRVIEVADPIDLHVPGPGQ